MTQKFNINTLIQKGKELVFEYELPAGTIYYRPLTDLEMDEAEAYRIKAITDSTTLDYVIGLGSNETIDKTNVDFTQIIYGNAIVAYNIVLVAIQDFSDEPLTIEDISKLSGIKNLADEIRRASGYDDGVITDVEEFRENK